MSELAVGRSGVRASDVVLAGLKQGLLAGDFRQGQKLSVDELARDFSVSKQPVMEALRTLAFEGLVTIVPQVGSRVATYGIDEIRDFFRLFSVMEGTVADVAANRRSIEDLERLDAAHSRLVELIGSNVDDAVTRSRQYSQLNREFHSQIHAMARSPIITSRTQRMWDLSDFLVNTAESFPFHREERVRCSEHDRIREALRSQDADLAGREMQQHIRSIFEDVWG